MKLPIRTLTDSSAAIGICSRQGLGKLRHIDTHTLWLQQAVRCKRIEVKKIAGECNPADLFTKHSLSADRVRALVELQSYDFRGGRAASAPQTRKTATGKIDISEADALHPVEICDNDKNYAPHMPHLNASRREIDLQYPSLEAVDDICFEDLIRLEDDGLYSQGMKIVQQILHDMATQGRKRYADSRVALDTTVEGTQGPIMHDDRKEPNTNRIKRTLRRDR